MGCSIGKEALEPLPAPDTLVVSATPMPDSLSDPKIGNSMENDNYSEHTMFLEPISEDTVAYETVFPHIGFVIKTRRLNDGIKIFINVLHFESVDGITSAHYKEHLNYDGTISLVFDVIIPTSIFEKVVLSSNKQANNAICLEVMSHINEVYSESLDVLCFKTPRIRKGYIGPEIDAVDLPLPSEYHDFPASNFATEQYYDSGYNEARNCDKLT